MIRSSPLLLQVVLLASGLAVSASRAVAQTEDPTPRTFAGWLRQGMIDSDSLIAKVPGFVELHWNLPTSCSYTVYLVDPARQARRAVRILAPLVKDRCPSDPHIYTTKSAFSLNDAVRIREELVQILRAAGEPLREVAFDRSRWYISTLNPLQRDRVAALLRLKGAKLPLSSIDLRLGGPPYELDPPIRPIPAVYLAIADSFPAGTIIDSTGLAGDVVDALRRRFRLSAGECSPPSKGFGEPQGYEDDRYLITTFWRGGLGQQHWEVKCREAICHVSRDFGLGLMDVIIGCRGARTP